MINNVSVVKNAIDHIYVDLKTEKYNNQKICLIGTFDYGNNKHYEIVKGTIATYGIAWKTNLYYHCVAQFAKYYNNLSLSFVPFDYAIPEDRQKLINELQSYPNDKYILLDKEIVYFRIGR